MRSENYPPLSVFAEATTTNGSRIIPFKRGAFAGMRTVTPCHFTSSNTMISPAYELIDMIQLQILLFSALSFRVTTLTIMPEFTPNAYMLENFADKDRGGPWSIYAWCVRDAICKNSGILPLDEKLSLKDKLAFVSLMNAYSDRAEINGQLFEFSKNDKPVQDVSISNPALMRRLSTITYKLNADENIQSGLLIKSDRMQSSVRDLNQNFERMNDSFGSDKDESEKKAHSEGMEFEKELEA